MKNFILWMSTFAIANGNHSLIHWIRDFVRKQKCENNRNISKESEIFINFIKWFAPKNESIWEHVKMGYFPMLLLTVIFDRNTDYNARICALWIHLIVMLISYYLYTYYIYGEDKLFINIPLYFACCLVGYFSEKLLTNVKIGNQMFKDNKIIRYGTIGLTCLIVVLSYVDHAKTVNNDPGVWKLPWNIPDKPNVIYDLFENKEKNYRFLYVKCTKDEKQDENCQGKYLIDPKRPYNNLSEYDCQYLLKESFLWWSTPIDQDGNKTSNNDDKWAKQATDTIQEAVNNNNIDLVIGFSQGATAAIVWDFVHNNNNIPLLLLCGYLPTNLIGVMNILNNKKKSDTTVLVYRSQNDTAFYEMGGSILSYYNNYIDIDVTSGNHAIPTNYVEQLAEILKKLNLQNPNVLCLHGGNGSKNVTIQIDQLLKNNEINEFNTIGINGPIKV
tara:strand:+ start:11 stop:1339 length:1329 start_codon:yes stop_codon:yes gene_type:complete